MTGTLGSDRDEFMGIGRCSGDVYFCKMGGKLHCCFEKRNKNTESGCPDFWYESEHVIIYLYNKIVIDSI